MSQMMRTGSMYRVVSEEDVEILNELPAQTYTVNQDPMTKEFFLTPVGSFEMPAKFYGTTLKDAVRILNTYESRPGTTGVHLSGIKGSGKTLLAKLISVKGLEIGIPTILINTPLYGDDFNRFIQSIKGRAIIIFDEFEKIYEYDKQTQILTLLDGVYNSKKLFIVTSNNSFRVNEFMKNRPGRIYYDLKFDTLSPEFVKEYCEENLKDQSQIKAIVDYVTAFSFFSFDMMSAIVEEMNRYGETLREVLRYLNIQPEVKPNESYTLTLVVKDREFLIDRDFKGMDPNEFSYTIDVDDHKLFAEDDRDLIKSELSTMIDEWSELTFRATDISEFDPRENQFTYSLQSLNSSCELVVKKNNSQNFNFYSHLV